MLISLETLHLKHSRQVFERGHDETRAGGHVPPASTCASICKITVPSLLSRVIYSPETPSSNATIRRIWPEKMQGRDVYSLRARVE